jgi:hypothetical protein
VLRQLGDAADGLYVRRGQVLQSHALLPLAGWIFPLNAFLAAGRWPLAAGRWPLAAGCCRVSYEAFLDCSIPREA